MTPTQPRIRHIAHVHEGFGYTNCNGKCWVEQEVAAIEEEAVSEYREALRGTRRFEMNIDGSPCWCEEEPPSYAPHEKWCEQARLLLQADQPSGEEPG